MGEAYECDRCGSVYPDSPAFALRPENGYGRARPDDGPSDYRERISPPPQDLCPACCNDLRRWWQDGGGDWSDVSVTDDGE